MQVASMRYSSKADFSGSALHILHRGSNYITYIATAQQTGLKLLLKAYDLGKPSYCWQLAGESLLQAMPHHCIASRQQLHHLHCHSWADRAEAAVQGV